MATNQIKSSPTETTGVLGVSRLTQLQPVSLLLLILLQWSLVRGLSPLHQPSFSVVVVVS